MKIAISADGPSLDSRIDPRFGRCAYFLIVDLDSAEVDVVNNTSADLGGGAGIQAAQTLVDKGVKGLITGNCGPNATKVLSAAGVEIITGFSGLVRDAVENYKIGRLSSGQSGDVMGYGTGLGGRGTGGGRGRGGGFGMGGGGRGMGGGRRR
jgi:predicted Fe-Mo cluster-binding NifX family protein